jgi:hypothetical protein
MREQPHDAAYWQRQIEETERQRLTRIDEAKSRVAEALRYLVDQVGPDVTRAIAEAAIKLPAGRHLSHQERFERNLLLTQYETLRDLQKPNGRRITMREAARWLNGERPLENEEPFGEGDTLPSEAMHSKLKRAMKWARERKSSELP